MKKILRNLFVCALALSSTVSAWGDCYLIENGNGSVSNVKAANTIVYQAELDGKSTGTISFSMYSNNGWGPSVTIQYSKDNGSSWKDVTAIKYSNGTKSNQTASIDTEATNVRFINKSSTTGAYNYSITNVYLERAVSFKADASSMDLGITSAGKAKSNSVGIVYNALENQTITSSISGSNTNLFSCKLSKTTLDCTGTVTANVSFNPTESTPAGDYSCTVNISAGNQTATINVSAKVTEATITSINWDQSFMSLSIYDEVKTIDLEASVVDQKGAAIPGANVVYTLGDNADGIVSLNGNQLIIGSNIGETTITATYTSIDEDTYTSSSNTKHIVVGDGSACNTLLVNESNTKDCNSATFVWNAPADKLNLQYKKLSGLTFTGEMYVDAYDASNAKTRLATYNNSSTSWKNAPEIQLDRSYRKIVVTANTESGSHYVQNVTITQATYLEAVSTSLNATGEGIASTSVSFNYSNLPTAVSASLEGVQNEVLLETVHIGDGCSSWKDGATMNLTFRPNGSGKRQYTYDGNLVLSAGSGDNITSIKIPLIVTITMPYGDLTGHYAMFYNESEVSVTADAYYATWAGFNGEAALELIKIESNVPAQTPVLLHDKNSDFYTYEVIVEPVNPTLAPTDNAFVHTDAAFVQDNINYNYYVLAKKDNQVAFYKFTGTIPTGKVVLVWDRNTNLGNAPERFNINMTPGITTALVPVYANEQSHSGQIFTIMGVPVADMSHPGIYIVNGKKYIVR